MPFCASTCSAAPVSLRAPAGQQCSAATLQSGSPNAWLVQPPLQPAGTTSWLAGATVFLSGWQRHDLSLWLGVSLVQGLDAVAGPQHLAEPLPEVL